MNLSDIMGNIQEKLGKEASAKISDDIANVLVYEDSNNKLLKEKDEKIEKLGKDKEMLIEANGNLLLQVPRGKDEGFNDPSNKKEEPKKPFDYRTLFDNKGNLKR